MTIKVLLPGGMGGGECEIASDLTSGGWPNHVVVKVPDEQVGHWYCLVPRDALTPVTPPLPEEPPNSASVRIGEDGPVFLRHDADCSIAVEAGINWLRVGVSERFTWAEICRLSMEMTGRPPVPLIAAPIAGQLVTLPWTCTDSRGDHVSITSGDDQDMAVLRVTETRSGRMIDVEVSTLDLYNAAWTVHTIQADLP